MYRRKKSKTTKKYLTGGIIAMTLLVVISSIAMFFVRTKQQKKVAYSNRILSSCDNLEQELESDQTDNIKMRDKGRLNSESSLTGTVTNASTEKYRFTPKEDRKLEYKTTDSVQVCVYDDQNRLVKDNLLEASLEHSIFIITQEDEQNYNLQFNPKVIDQEIALKPDNSLEVKEENREEVNSTPEVNISDNFPQPIPPEETEILGENVHYNIQRQPNLKKSQQLQLVVDNLLTLCQANQLPISNVSITLIDVNQNTIAQHKGDVLRYPASVVKLFWLVTLYSYVEEGKINLDSQLASEINKMMAKSDNEAASFIIDTITQTQSGRVISSNQFYKWYLKRNQLNDFFHKAGYSNLNITQKTFPIPILKEYGKRPKGRDLKMRHLEGRDENNPIRNKLTTWHSARLMYEIINNQAISPRYSQKIQSHLERDLNPQAWKNIDPRFEFNPVRAFFGESLPTNIRFLSKAGWTSSTRQEVAYIETPDQKTKYILAIFVEDQAYAKNWDIFPKLSKSAFQQMTQ
jgi:beta-lactamase class A